MSFFLSVMKAFSASSIQMTEGAMVRATLNTMCSSMLTDLPG